MEPKRDVFKVLSSLDISDYVEGYGADDSIMYIEWAVAWDLVKKEFPSAEWEISEFQHDPNNLLKFPYLKTPQGFFVHGKVTIDGIAMYDWYDLVETNPTAANITKGHQRCLVKCLGRHGLGISLWQKDKREKIKQDLKDSSGKESTDHKKNTASKSSAKTGEYKIDLGTQKSGKPHWLNGLTLEQAWIRPSPPPGSNSLRDQVDYYHSNSFRNAQIKDFLSHAEPFLKAKQALKLTEPYIDEAPPFEEEDLPPWEKMNK